MRVSRGSAAAIVVVFLGILLGVLGSLIQVPYAVMRAGPISNVLGTTTHSDRSSADLIVINGHENFPTTGSLDFTTVRINGGPGYPVNVWSVVGAWIDPRQDVYPVDAIAGRHAVAGRRVDRRDAALGAASAAVALGATAAVLRRARQH